MRKKKDKLRGALKFFSGDKNNLQVFITKPETKIDAEKEDLISCGGIFATNEVIQELTEIVGTENINLRTIEKE